MEKASGHPRSSIEKSSVRSTQKRAGPKMLLLPLALWLLCFAVIPLLYGLYLSFHEVRIINLHTPIWAGLSNYISLVKMSAFHKSILWSFRFAAISVPIEMIIGLGLTQLYSKDFPGKGVATTLLLIPMIVSPALMGTMFRLLFNEFVGPIAYLISGLIGTTALLSMTWVNPTIIVADMINRTPMIFLNTYSAQQGVSEELLEAATVDGANGWNKLTKIILPLILPIMGLTFLERILAAFLIFELVFAMTSGGPGSFTQSVSIFIYTRAFERSDFGMANASSLMVAIILFGPALFLVKRMMRSIR